MHVQPSCSAHYGHLVCNIIFVQMVEIKLCKYLHTYGKSRSIVADFFEKCSNLLTEFGGNVGTERVFSPFLPL